MININKLNDFLKSIILVFHLLKCCCHSSYRYFNDQRPTIGFGVNDLAALQGIYFWLPITHVMGRIFGITEAILKKLFTTAIQSGVEWQKAIKTRAALSCVGAKVSVKEYCNAIMIGFMVWKLCPSANNNHVVLCDGLWVTSMAFGKNNWHSLRFNYLWTIFWTFIWNWFRFLTHRSWNTVKIS